MKTSLAYLRPWKLSDAKFVIKLRNNPQYRQYFRQDRDISLNEQIAFMKEALSFNYDGYILIKNNKRIGVFALHGSELCVVCPLAHQALGIRILRKMNPALVMYGDVFSHNPALPIYLSKCGFKVYGVKERYCKKDGTWVSAIKISTL